MSRKLFGGAITVVGTAAATARHLLWYVSYQVDGNSRADDFAPLR